ncbi:MAG: hypothetical protein R3B47_05530 [Bacteroidia bacterium]
MLSNGGSGTQVPQDTIVHRSWQIVPESGGVNARVEVQWNGAEQGTRFSQSSAYLSKSTAGAAYQTLPGTALSASGGDPATIYATGVSSFSYFAVGSFPITLDFEEDVREEIASEGRLQLSPNPFAHFPQLINSDEAWESELSMEVFDYQGKRLFSAFGEIEALNVVLKRMAALPGGCTSCRCRMARMRGCGSW